MPGELLRGHDRVELLVGEKLLVGFVNARNPITSRDFTGEIRPDFRNRDDLTFLGKAGAGVVAQVGALAHRADADETDFDGCLRHKESVRVRKFSEFVNG